MTELAATPMVVMAGGTGGHVFPGLAVAKELQSRGCDIAWLGTRRGIESRLVPGANIPIHYLDIQGVRGKKILGFIVAPFQILRAIFHVRRWFKEFGPKAVIGLGGYAAGPGGIAAWSLGIPLVIHEQNASAGTTNKILSRFARRVLVAFDNALPNSTCIGNPVRDSFATLPLPEARINLDHSRLRILVLGGSLGATAINALVPKAIGLMPKKLRPSVVHQAGNRHLEAAQNHYQNHAVDAEVTAFIEDVPAALANADLVVCRAGALTIAELSATGVASILVPFPYAIDDHQTANARWLVERGGAILKQQSQLTAQQLSQMIMELSEDRPRLLRMANAARACAKLNATDQFADACMEVANGYS